MAIQQVLDAICFHYVLCRWRYIGGCLRHIYSSTKIDQKIEKVYNYV